MEELRNQPKPAQRTRWLFYFWAVPYDGAVIDYYKVVAVSEKQAVYLFKTYARHVVAAYDYSGLPTGCEECRSDALIGVYGGGARV